MRVAGIIAEYNPFHAGHLAQILKIREEEAADYIVVAMSGDFVQRGEPALFDKYTRAEAALRAGADLVLELPVLFATAPAPDFAAAGVALLDRLHVVDELVFGSECGDLSVLKTAARFLTEEPEPFKQALRKNRKSGDSFSLALAKAFSSSLSEGEESLDDSRILSLFSSPNNILGVEYIRALSQRGSTLTPVTYRRLGQPYRESVYDPSIDLPSASALRAAVALRELDYASYLLSLLPGAKAGGFSDFTPLFPNDLSLILNEKILETFNGKSKEAAVTELCACSGFTSDLANRLWHRALNLSDFAGRISQLKTKAFTYAHISRALLHLVLGIRKDAVNRAKENDYVCYARVLGFRKTAGPLLTAIHRNSTLPLLTKTADASSLLNADGYASLALDFYASHLYRALVFEKDARETPNEFTRSVLIV